MNVDYGVVHGTMDNGHVMRTFFKFWKMGRINCGVFGVFPVEISAHILSVYMIFHLSTIISTKKNFKYFEGKSIWAWDMNFELQRIRNLAIVCQ